MSSIGDRVRDARIAKEMNRSELARATGITSQALLQLENGETKAPTPENLFKLADALGEDARYLATGERRLTYPKPADHAPGVPPQAHERAPIKAQSFVPLVSWTTAGNWSDVSDPYSVGEGETTVAITAKVGRHAFALRVRGDSMEPRIPDGSIVVIDPGRTFDHGSIVLAKRVSEQQATLKLLWYDNGTPFLKPANDKYPIMPMPEDARIIGVAVQWFTNALAE
jgi:SOS-response transcriptional repressor LexA